MSEEQHRMMFPPFLDQGSEGLAVFYLQALLCALGWLVQLTGVLDDKTSKAIKKLQEHLGFGGKDVDGNFGPATRKKMSEKFGLDVSIIPMPIKGGCTRWCSPYHDGFKDWFMEPPEPSICVGQGPERTVRKKSD